MAIEKSEIKRKLVHILFGVVVVIMLKFGLIGWLHIFFLTIIGIVISFLCKKYNIPFVNYCLNVLERNENLRKFPGKGVVFYFVGIFLILLFFPNNLDIVMAAILILAFGDTAGYIFGVEFGRIKHPFTDKKFLEGMVAGIIAGFLGAIIFVPWHEAIIASFFAMVAEGIEIKIGLEEVDDNIVMPLVAAVSIWAVRVLF